MPTREPIYTLGHSNHSPETLGELLARHYIRVLVDVRSAPYSRYASQFNREALRDFVTAVGCEYVYMGQELGGMPDAPGFYDEGGHVRYDLIAASDRFRQGIQQLLAMSTAHRIVLLCSEEEPRDCHRHLLLARVLAEHDAPVMHIRADGTIVSDEELTRAVETERTGGQQPLFEIEEEPPWRSTRSATRRNPPPNSSEP
jgi:uncharacterized protein (DUF488 family)